MIRCSIIVALNQYGLIGLEDKLPWKVTEDMKFFKRQTLGKFVIVGRKTYDSLPPLPGRLVIVLSASPAPATYPSNVHYVNTWAEARKIAIAGSRHLNRDEYLVIGGRTVYAQALGYADRLYLTNVNDPREQVKLVGAQVFFPEVAQELWNWVSSEQLNTKSRFTAWVNVMDRVWSRPEE